MNRAELIAYLSEQMGVPVEDGKFNQRFYKRSDIPHTCLVVSTNGGEKADIGIDFYEDEAQKRTTPIMHGGDPQQQWIIASIPMGTTADKIEIALMRTGGVDMREGDIPGITITASSFFKRMRKLKLQALES